MTTWGRRLADTVRALTALSALVSLLWVSGEGAVRFGLLFLVLLVPRLIHIAAPFDLVVCLTLLIATWASVLRWYATIVWVDEVTHLITLGAVAAAAYLGLVREGLLPSPQEEVFRTHRSTFVLLITFFGLGLGTLWEFYEWVAEQIAPKGVFVGYTDTIVDLALGGVGCLVAAVLIVVWNSGSPRRP